MRADPKRTGCTFCGGRPGRPAGGESRGMAMGAGSGRVWAAGRSPSAGGACRGSSARATLGLKVEGGPCGQSKSSGKGRGGLRWPRDGLELCLAPGPGAEGMWAPSVASATCPSAVGCPFRRPSETCSCSVDVALVFHPSTFSLKKNYLCIYFIVVKYTKHAIYHSCLLVHSQWWAAAAST